MPHDRRPRPVPQLRERENPARGRLLDVRQLRNVRLRRGVPVMFDEDTGCECVDFQEAVHTREVVAGGDVAIVCDTCGTVVDREGQR